MPRLILATCNIDVTCKTAKSSIVNLCKTLPSTLFIKKFSLCWGSPVSSNHRKTQAVSNFPAFVRYWSLDELTWVSIIANCNFFLCKTFLMFRSFSISLIEVSCSCWPDFTDFLASGMYWSRPNSCSQLQISSVSHSAKGLSGLQN